MKKSLWVLLIFFIALTGCQINEEQVSAPVKEGVVQVKTSVLKDDLNDVLRDLQEGGMIYVDLKVREGYDGVFSAMVYDIIYIDPTIRGEENPPGETNSHERNSSQGYENDVDEITRERENTDGIDNNSDMSSSVSESDLVQYL